MAFWGNIFFGFFGALIKWGFSWIKFGVFRKRYPKPFTSIWFGDNNPDIYGMLSNDFSNKLIGFIFLMLVVYVIFWRDANA